ncbi:MAG: alkaline phosphatase D family protein [Planctomycetaceae bacterium]|nr:alkaline phosphatase D family protein [Planctomycetaceae bacterium]
MFDPRKLCTSTVQTLLFLSYTPVLLQAQELLWPDPIANHVAPAETLGLTHGPMLGQPASDSMTVWIRTKEPMDFTIRYATEVPLNSESPGVEGVTVASDDNTGTVTLKNLKPSTTYFYAVEIDGRLADTRIDFHDPWPRFRTLPDATVYRDTPHNPDGRFNICFSIGCCASQDPVRSGGQYGSPPAFDTLFQHHRDDVQFHIMNGDTIYEEERDGTLDGLWNNYRLYWKRGRSWARLTRTVPTMFTYDDHELGWDIHGSGAVGLKAGKHLIRDYGLKAWGDYVGWANHPNPQNAPVFLGKTEFSAGSDLLRDPQADFSPLKLSQISTLHIGPYPGGALRQKAPKPPQNAGVYKVVEIVDSHTLKIEPPFRADETAEYSIGTHHYRDWKIGNCHFLMVDTRGERSKTNLKNVHDPEIYALGETQRKWLIETAQNSDAEFLFLISPDPWLIYHSAYHVAPERGADPKGDGMASFVHEREQVLKALDQIDKPVMLFSGDVHNSMSVRVTDNIWEFMVGPMGSTAHPIGTAGRMPFGGRWKSQGRPVKIKWVAGFPDNVQYDRLRSTYYSVVSVNNVMKTTKPEGSGYQFVAYDTPQVIVSFYNGYTGKLVYAEAVSPIDLTPAPQASK